jgi:hypothetical protein
MGITELVRAQIRDFATETRLVSVAEAKIVRWNRGFQHFFAANSACYHMCSVTHVMDDSGHH